VDEIKNMYQECVQLAKETNTIRFKSGFYRKGHEKKARDENKKKKMIKK